MKKHLFKLSLLTAILFAGIPNTVNGQITGFDKESFDFENGSPENWTQKPGFTTTTDQVASGEKSMKAEFDDYSKVKKGPKLQSFRKNNLSNGVFDMKAGTYKMSVKVYLKGEVPRYLAIATKSSSNNKDIRLDRLDRLKKNTWHTLTDTFTLEKDFNKQNLAFKFNNFPKTGSGTIYVDDFNLESITAN